LNTGSKTGEKCQTLADIHLRIRSSNAFKWRSPLDSSFFGPPLLGETPTETPTSRLSTNYQEFANPGTSPSSPKSGCDTGSNTGSKTGSNSIDSHFYGPLLMDYSPTSY
jgi:hypothetical protein